MPANIEPEKLDAAGVALGVILLQLGTEDERQRSTRLYAIHANGTWPEVPLLRKAQDRPMATQSGRTERDNPLVILRVT